MSAQEEHNLLVEAMMRIGRTEDGRRFYLHLQKTLLAVDELPPGLDASGTLREIHGRRLFMRQLRDWLAPGIKQIEANIDERPVVFTRPEPVRLAPALHGAARRVRELPAAVDQSE
jgi:hypothetical protein